MITVPVSRATSPSAAVDFPGTSSAKSKFLWSSVWQKYCDLKSSGRQTICAPCLAASRINSNARPRFFSGSAPQRIWINPIFVMSSGSRDISRFFENSKRFLDFARNDNSVTESLFHRISWDDFDALDHHAFGRLARFAHAVLGHLDVTDFLQHILAFDQFAKGGVLVI